ncbi:unnamed protein product, partial [Closterium sp. Naga37s-1]
MTAFNLDPEQNWSEGAPCSDDGTGSGFKGVICDSNGNPRAMIPTLGNSLVGLRSLPTAFARLTTLTRLVLIMGLINTRLDDFARPLSCLPNLRHLVLDGNSFYGPVPPYLINSPSLTDLSLQGNKLTGTIKAVGSKLTALFLSVNLLTASLLPASRLQHQAFELTKRNPILPFPSPPSTSLQQPPSPSSSLQGNKLTGTIRKIGPKLTALFLSVNFLTGPLPPAARRLRVCNAAMNCLSRTSGWLEVQLLPHRNLRDEKKMRSMLQTIYKTILSQIHRRLLFAILPEPDALLVTLTPAALLTSTVAQSHRCHRATDPMSQLTSAAALVARPLPPPPTVLLPPAFAQRPAALLPRRKHASPNHAPLKLRAPLVLRASATSSQREPPEGSDSRPPPPPPPPMKVMSRSAKNVRRMMSAASPPALGQFRPPPLPIPGAPMFPMGAPGGEDSGEAEEGRRKERERREELIAAVREGRGSWQEVAAAIRQLQQAGMTAEEVADVAMLAHGRVTVLVVAAQVYESLLPGAQEVEGEGPDSSFDVAVAFHAEQSAELLYELRTLPTAGRRQAAAYVAQQGLDAGGVRELVRAMRDHARRSNSRE